MVSEKNSNSVWIDLCRGIAAILVCIGHIKNAFIVDYAQIEYQKWWHAGLYFISGLGHQSVIVFFVLSGYLVGGGLLKNKKIFTWRLYLTSRVVRLLVVLVPALIFTLITDLTILKFNSSAYDGSMAEIWNSGPRGDFSLDIGTFVLNIVFLQTVFSPVYGSNGPLWSLANEFWYYILFPCVLYGFGFVGVADRLKRTISLIAALTIIMLMPNEMKYGFLIWILGAICWIIKSKIFVKSNVKTVILSSALFFIVLVCSKSEKIKSQVLIDFDVAVSIAFVGMLFFLLRSNYKLKNNNLMYRLIGHISKISYTLYLFHFPVVCAASIYYMNGEKMQPSIKSVAVVIFVMIFLVLLSWFNWWIFERNTGKIKNLINKF